MKKSNKRQYWFKRRRYGYGWTPVTWRGWLTVLLFLAAILFCGAVLLKDTPQGTFSTEVFIFLALVVVSVILLLAISLAKGPKPKWRWGKGGSDDPDEDI